MFRGRLRVRLWGVSVRGGDLHPRAMPGVASVTYRVEVGPGWEMRCGDCLDPVTGLASLADRSVDQVITDPPYSKVVVTSAKRAPSNVIGGAETRSLGYEGITPKQIWALGVQWGRVCRRWCLTYCDAESLTLWRRSHERGGLRHARMGAWVAPNCTPQFTGDRPGTGWEACEISHAPSGRWRWNGGGLPAVWVVPRPANGTQERISTGHPTPKPLPLLLLNVEQFTDPGELIADPFAGSGTTGVACIRLGRRFIGWEKDPKYFDVAVKRLRAAREQLRIPLVVEPMGKQADLLAPPRATEEGG